MPVTARLSKKFYDRLGEDIAAELVDWFNQVDATYRSDLREVNELNFARFDAKLEQRLAAFELHIERRFVALEVRVTKLEAAVSRLESAVREGFAAIDARFAAVDGKIATVDARITTAVGAARESLLRWMIGLWLTQLLAFAGLLLSRG